MLHTSETVRTYMEKGIRHVASTYKGRAAGSDPESEAQDYFVRELGTVADDVKKEPFRLHPKAFLGWLIPAGIFDLTAVAMYWLRGASDSLWIAVLGAVCICLSFCMDLFEFILYRRFVDRLFPAATSHNVYARRKAQGETKRRIVFCGHADAAHEMTFARHGGRKTLGPVLVLSTVGMMYMMALNITVLVRALQGNPAPLTGIWLTLGIIALLFVPFFIGILCFMNWGRVVDGANDNLTGCFVAMGVLKALEEQNIRFENTEVCCLITGAEEAGLRGALAFAGAHRDAFSAEETFFVVLDTMRETSQLMVYTRGQNGLVKNSAKVGDLLRKAGDACGHPLPVANSFLGATDAEAFSRHGLKACGFCGVNHDPKPYYHTREDTADNIDMDCVALSLDICLKALAMFDEGAHG